MQSHNSSSDARAALARLRRPTADDEDEFIALTRASVDFLRPWIDPPTTSEQFENYLRRLQSDMDNPILICDANSSRIVGVINMSCIVRGQFQSAYLGYWIGVPYARRGYMKEAMGLLIANAFSKMALHRLEADIQPDNLASITLARACGFIKEGYSPKYLRVFGEWRDHKRWAIHAES